jgi:prevent-host-death family protein
MTTQVTATEAKARLLALLDEVERGEEVVITRRGKVVARLAPPRPSRDLKNLFAGIAVTVDPEDDLYSTGVTWNAGDDGPS